MTSETTVEQRVKIIRNNTLGKIEWDTDNNNWEKSSIEYLLNNGDYYNRLNSYIESGLKETARNQIEKVTWSIGEYLLNRTSLNDLYRWDHSQGELWEGNVAFISMSDFYYAISNRTSNVLEELENDNLTKNWLFISYDYMILDHLPRVNNDLTIYSISDTYGRTSGHSASMPMGVIPSTYLKNDVKILNDNNDGSKQYPYDLT